MFWNRIGRSIPIFHSVRNRTLREPALTMSVNPKTLIKDAVELVPPLQETNHKGSSGRIGVFGGSVEFTGAPYFAGISALRIGADLVYVFSGSSAAPVIKSYSPELMVIPYLDTEDAPNRINPWIKRLHSILIGPGLGRHETVFNNVKYIVESLKKTPSDTGKYRPLIIDADGIHFLSHHQEVLKDYPGEVYLTPNNVEFNHLVNVILGHNYNQPTEVILKALSTKIGKNVTILLKGNVDLISNAKFQITCDVKGSMRRCGGQGDLLSGVLATFAAWTAMRRWTDAPPINAEIPDNILAAYAASFLTRTCSNVAYSIHWRSMLVTDMIAELPKVFRTHFEAQSSFF